MKFSKCIFLNLLTMSSILAQSSDSEKIYQSVLKATFTHDKIEAAKAFLKKNECKDGVYTQKLLKDSNYWNREAGVYLAGECKNPKLDKAMCDLFLEDHMVRNPIKDLIKKEPNRYSKILTSLYKKDLWEPTKRELFELYELTQDEETYNFLLNIVKNQKSPDRTPAFKSLLKNKKKIDPSLIQSFLEDKELRKFSLQWLAEFGTKSELKIFQEILSNPKSNEEELASACIAIKNWGDEKEKKLSYLRFIKEDTQRLLPVAISIFSGILDDEIFKELSRLTRAGKTQIIRTEATMELKNYSGSKKYPYIILFLQEEYQPQDGYHSGDSLANLFTLGIYGAFKGLQEKQKRNKFYSIQSELIQILQKETGENYKTAQEWKVWANQKKLLPITITYE